jgi:hypothetical protein
MANLAIDNIDEFFKTGNCKNKVNWRFISTFNCIKVYLVSIWPIF